MFTFGSVRFKVFLLASCFLSQLGAQMPTQRFTSTYNGELLGACSGTAYEITGYAPVATGVKFPLLVFTTGTWAPYNDPNTLAVLEAAAAKGLVAVTAQYDNNWLMGCSNLRQKSKCVYDPMETTSAVGKLCMRPDVDCSLGIIVTGVSQGSQLAVYAKNWNSRVRAVYGLGVSSDYFWQLMPGDNPGLSNPAGTSDDQCLLDSQTAIPSDRVRFVNGQDDMCYSTSTRPCGGFSGQGEVQRISGSSCPPEAMSCLNANGSGWYVVPNATVQDRSADHLYFLNGNGLDPGFLPAASNAWSWGHNIEWLETFLGPANAVPVRINAGSSAVDGPFSKDDGFSGSNLGTFATGSAIDVTAPRAAPAAVYQSHRYSFWWGTLRYLVSGLRANTAYVVRLHFAEIWHDRPGARKFHVNIQGVRRETDLDVLSQAGAKNKALVKEYTIVSDGSGLISIDLITGSVDNPMISGIEVL